MTAARLSPAASLLRNSKLFGLPPAIALPATGPSSEPVPGSDTATTVHPTRAAIETTPSALIRGDWGFKRELPLKSTTRTTTPTVRLNDGIDTKEHIADFDSAADHVLTLKKFQELNQMVTHPQDRRYYDKQVGVFRRTHDNTTNKSSTAPIRNAYTGIWPNLSPSSLSKSLPPGLQYSPQNGVTQTDSAPPSQSSRLTSTSNQELRWRYDGPSLVRLSGLEFDQFMKTVDVEKRAAFRNKLRGNLIQTKRSEAAAAARDEAKVGEVDISQVGVTEAEVDQYLRRLRQEPEVFGPMIAEFLDLPEGPDGSGFGKSERKGTSQWAYGSPTLASEYYQQRGAPSTHPSAGISYIHSAKWAPNDAFFGPQHERSPKVARAVKLRNRGVKNTGSFGLAGFIVKTATAMRGIDGDIPTFDPQHGGQKTALTPTTAEVTEDGILELSTKPNSNYVVEDDNAVLASLAKKSSTTQMRSSGSRIMPSLSAAYRRREPLKPDENVDKELDALLNLSRSSR